MGYQSRNRNYKTRRERNADMRVRLRTVLIFMVLASAVWIYKNRLEYWLLLRAWWD